MSSKEAILNRLRGAAAPIAHAPHGWQPWRGADDGERRERFLAGISASHAEILTVKEATLARDLAAWLDEEGVTSLACGQGGRWQAAVAAACAGRSVLTPAGEFAGWKDDLFDACQAGITHCAGAIADTGTLVLLPDGGEPRTLSLVPPCLSPCWRPPPSPTTWRGWWRPGAGSRPCPPICCWSPAPPRPPTSSRPWPTVPTARAACW